MSSYKSKHSFATPLKKVKGLGAAHSGTGHFIKQRITAVFMVFLLLWLGMLILDIAAAPHSLRVILFGSAPNIVFSVLFVGNLLFHGYLGLQVVLEDYVHSRSGLVILLMSLKAFCIVTFIAFILAAITSLDAFVTFAMFNKILQELNP